MPFNTKQTSELMSQLKILVMSNAAFRDPIMRAIDVSLFEEIRNIAKSIEVELGANMPDSHAKLKTMYQSLQCNLLPKVEAVCLKLAERPICKLENGQSAFEALKEWMKTVRPTDDFVDVEHSDELAMECSGPEEAIPFEPLCQQDKMQQKVQELQQKAQLEEKVVQQLHSQLGMYQQLGNVRAEQQIRQFLQQIQDQYIQSKQELERLQQLQGQDEEYKSKRRAICNFSN